MLQGPEGGLLQLKPLGGDHESPSKPMEGVAEVSKIASTEGFSLGVFARTVIETMNSVEFVRATDVILLTSRGEIEALKDVFDRARKIAGVLIKMHEKKLLNCKECDYKDICNEVPGLKMTRDEITKNG